MLITFVKDRVRHHYRYPLCIERNSGRGIMGELGAFVFFQGWAERGGTIKTGGCL